MLVNNMLYEGLFLFFLLFLLIVIGLFNWFCANQVKKTEKQTGIVLPKKIDKLLLANIFLPIFVVLLIAFLIMTNIFAVTK